MLKVRTLQEFVEKYKPILSKVSGLPPESIAIKANDGTINLGNPNALIAFSLIHEITVYDINSFSSLFSFSLQQQINCCGMTVLTNVCVDEEPKYYPVIHRMFREIAKLQGYSAVMCTDVDVAHRQALKKSRWIELSAFKNRRTGNEIFVGFKKI